MKMLTYFRRNRECWLLLILLIIAGFIYNRQKTEIIEGFLDAPINGCLGDRGLENFRDPGLENFRDPGLDNLRDRGLENFRDRGLENFRDRGLDNLRDPGLEDLQGSVDPTSLDYSLVGKNYVLNPLDKMPATVSGSDTKNPKCGGCNACPPSWAYPGSQPQPLEMMVGVSSGQCRSFWVV